MNLVLHCAWVCKCASKVGSERREGNKEEKTAFHNSLCRAPIRRNQNDEHLAIDDKEDLAYSLEKLRSNECQNKDLEKRHEYSEPRGQTGPVSPSEPQIPTNVAHTELGWKK